MKEFLRKIAPIMTFIAVVASVSIICVALNNLFFVGPRDEALLNLSGVLTDVLEKHNGDIHMIEQEIDRLNHNQEILSNMEKNDLRAMKAVKMLFQIKNIQIMNLEKEVKTLKEETKELKRRHMEVLRAICILQKKHWREK